MGVFLFIRFDNEHTTRADRLKEDKAAPISDMDYAQRKFGKNI